MAENKKKRRRRLITTAGKIPPGTTPLPTGGYLHPPSEGVVYHDRKGAHRIYIRALQREEINLKQLASALLALAKDQLEAERQERDKAA